MVTIKSGVVCEVLQNESINTEISEWIAAIHCLSSSGLILKHTNVRIFILPSPYPPLRPQHRLTNVYCKRCFPPKNICQTFAAFLSTWKTITTHQMIGQTWSFGCLSRNCFQFTCMYAS